jgi:hypothetical protein
MHGWRGQVDALVPWLSSRLQGAPQAHCWPLLCNAGGEIQAFRVLPFPSRKEPLYNAGKEMGVRQNAVHTETVRVGWVQTEGARYAIDCCLGVA